MTLRPEVLDDGQGGKIVGWRDRDLASAELARWEAPAATRAVAIPVAIPSPKTVRVSPPVVAAAAPIAPLVKPAPAPAQIPIPAPIINVAPPAEPEEDEWEWEIALARARAAAETNLETVQAAKAPPVRPSRRSRVDTVPPPPAFIPAKTELGVAPAPASKPKFVEAKTAPMAVVAAPRDPISTGEWPKTEPLGNIDYDDRTNPMSEVVRVVRLHQAAKPVATIPAKPTPAPAPAHPRTFARAASPATVIPVPKLPRMTAQSSIEPVVRTRFPQATPVPRPSARPIIAPPPPIRPAEDDKTSPGMMAANAVALPRIPSIVKRAR